MKLPIPPSVVLAVAKRPDLWRTAIGQAGKLAGPGWWRRPPFLPVPDRDYMRFRLTTAYGDPDADPVPADVIAWLEWVRAWPRVTGA